MSGRDIQGGSMKNNIDKRLEGKGYKVAKNFEDSNVYKEIENNWIASERNDDDQVIIDMMPDIMQSLRDQFESLKREGYKGTFLDYIKSEISLKRRTALKKGGRVKN